MSGKEKTTPQQSAYQELQGKHEIKRPIVKNCLKAFLVGGIFCIVGQAISYFYIYFFNFTEQTAGGPTTATMVLHGPFDDRFRILRPHWPVCWGRKCRPCYRIR